ncbi:MULTISPECIES: sugar kinase [Methylosinus]|uniref:Sugar kinase n=1 Tax=Methylosinus trichosporium (strain ATCC 35070 / NCIMB 11131 / UNIQEM 75 / OB3b) TaxID=595536 RepID=A0A2D2CZF1_METT3|nr:MULTISPECIES: sugar kinase [Methylosinus]ATQ68086.1 sugar kinase [Methylosinus trichosporium OB3b]OBS54352.1 ribokinase [Methylosinus sp. 3S-1]
MDALFIGHAYIDVTMRTKTVPHGDQKSVAEDYAVSFGGNAVTAGFACAKLIGKGVDLVTSLAPDWLGHMFMDMTASYGIRVHPRRVRRSSLSFVLPNDGKRAILRARDADFLEDFPRIDVSGLEVLHVDGHMSDAAIHYARGCRETGALVSLDGGALRPGILELLDFVDVAVVAERLCEQMSLSETEMLAFLRGKGCRIGGVTTGEHGMLWYDESGEVSRLPALPVPKEKVVDTSGAGDVFHGAYVASFLQRPQAPWREHFGFARAASAFKIQHLGNEAGLPTQNDITATLALFPPTDEE